MTLRLPIGYSDFREIIENQLVLVDKTLMIKNVLDDGKILLFTRPRRFGKTLNLSMLYHYFSCQSDSEQDLFAGLKIKNEDEFYLQQQGKYPVIFITFKDVKSDTYDKAYAAIAAIIRQLFNEHRYLLQGENLDAEEQKIFHSILSRTAIETDLQGSLKLLSEYLSRHYGQRVIILIDEYDAPIHSAYVNGYYQEMVDFIRVFFSAGLKDNAHLHKAAITGILRVAKENIFSGLNNLKVYSFLHPRYAEYFGFTESEVNALFQQSGLEQDLAVVKAWYNGYKAGNTTLYNPWSILNCLSEEGQLGAYWVNTSDNALIKTILAESVPQLKEDFETLMSGGSVEGSIDPHLIFANLRTSRVACLTILMMSGYLKAELLKSQWGDNIYQMAIPNKEVMQLFQKTVIHWLSGEQGITWFADFLGYLTSGDMPRFEQAMQQIAMSIFSYYDVKGKEPENFFHGFTLGLIVALRDDYVVLSNRESGLGRYDIALIPKQKGVDARAIIFEIKSIEDDSAEALVAGAQTALTQINTQLYAAEMQQWGVKRVLKLGVAFCGKSLKLVYE